jgi:hypothetical protein
VKHRNAFLAVVVVVWIAVAAVWQLLLQNSTLGTFLLFGVMPAAVFAISYLTSRNRRGD